MIGHLDTGADDAARRTGRSDLSGPVGAMEVQAAGDQHRQLAAPARARCPARWDRAELSVIEGHVVIGDPQHRVVLAELGVGAGQNRQREQLRDIGPAQQGEPATQQS